MKHKRKKSSAVHLHKTQILAVIIVTLLLAALTAFAVIGSITASTVSVSIDRPVQYTNGEDPFLPGTNRRFVIITLHVTNRTKDIVHFAPVLQTHLTDKNGTRYDMAPAHAQNPIKAGEIAPGETRSGQLSYNVAQDAENLVFHFYPSDAAKEIRIGL